MTWRTWWPFTPPRRLTSCTHTCTPLATEPKTLPTMPDWVPTVPIVIGLAFPAAGAGPGAGVEPPPGTGFGTAALLPPAPPGDFEPVPAAAGPAGLAPPL